MSSLEYYSALLDYMNENTSWLYYEFLILYYYVIVSSPPFSDEWIGLDSTWTRRFLKKAEDLRPEELENLKVKVELEHSDKGLQTYWEGVIHKRMKLEVKRTHILGSLHLLNDDGKYNIKDLSSEGFSNSLSINASSTSKHTLDSTIPVSFKRTKKVSTKHNL
ncbi:11421_t:CDS:2 [Funneliformis geosporum]|nr:11421_t:CDS:2 [Funneliformis geosporum]